MKIIDQNLSWYFVYIISWFLWQPIGGKLSLHRWNVCSGEPWGAPATHHRFWLMMSRTEKARQKRAIVSHAGRGWPRAGFTNGRTRPPTPLAASRSLSALHCYSLTVSAAILCRWHVAESPFRQESPRPLVPRSWAGNRSTKHRLHDPWPKQKGYFMRWQ